MTTRLASLVGAILCIGLNPGCSKESTNEPPPSQQTDAWKGITLTPRSFGNDDFLRFFELADETGDVVSWGGDWIELADTLSGGAIVLAELATTYDFQPLIAVQVFDPESGELLRPLDEANRTFYQESAVWFCGKYKPPYFAIGGEVNILAASSPSDFDGFVSLYGEVEGAVRLVSPATKVFTIFQLEKMKGLNGGLFGGTNDPTAHQWDLLERFPNADLVAFTTYPCLIYGDPSEIPEDYYADVATRTDLPIVFTEIGWFTAATIPGWESSETEQEEYVLLYFDAISELIVEGSIWSFLYDQQIPIPFDSMGLRRQDDTARPAWYAWLALEQAPHESLEANRDKW